MRILVPVPFIALAATLSFGCVLDDQERSSGRGAGGAGGGDQGGAASADDEEGEPGDVDGPEGDDAAAEGAPPEEGGEVGEDLDRREGGHGDEGGPREGGEGDAVDPECPPESDGTEGCQCFGNATCGGVELICENGVCVPRPPGLPFGSLCEENDGCRGQWCIQPLAGGPARCSRTCNEDCPLGWDCRNFTVGGGDQVFLCVPPPHPCAACDIDADCGGSPYKCLSAWGGAFLRDGVWGQ